MIHCGIVTVHKTEKSISLLENRRTVDHMKCEMIFFIMLLCCIVNGELCIRLLNNDAEFDAILNIPGRLWRWNSVDTKFEMIEALKYNRSAICSIKEARDIQGRTITVIADMMPPYIMLDEHSDTVTGYIGEVWTILQNKLKFKTFFERANPASGRSLVDGKADEILAATAIHTSAASYFAYSTPVATSSYSLFILSDGSGVSTWWYIKIFNIKLWLTIIMFMIVIWGVVVLIYVLRRSVYSRTSDRYADSVMPPINFITILGGVTGQGFPRMPTSWSLRLLVLSILVMGMLIAVEFNSTLTSFLAIKGTSLPISNLQDVVKKKTHSLCLRNDSTAYIHFTDTWTVEGNIKKEWSDLVNKNCPDMRNRKFLYSHLCQQGVVYLEAPIIFQTVYNEVKEKCHIVQIPGNYWSLKLAILHARASPHKFLIDFYLLKLREAGILMYLQSKWISNKGIISSAATQPQGSFQPVQHEHVYLTCLCLLIVMAISTIICIVENIWYRYQVRRRKQNARCIMRKMRFLNIAGRRTVLFRNFE